MIRKTGFRVLLSLVFVLFTYSFAFAQTPEFNFKKDNVYLSLKAGVAILNDIDFSQSLSYAGVTANASGTSEYDQGYSISGTIGYILNKLTRIEFELGFAEMDHDKATGAITFTSGGTTLATVGGSVNVIGEVKALTGTTNLLFTPFGSKFGGVTPFIGGGIGFVDWEVNIDSISAGGTTLVINGQETDTDFLSAIIAGLEYDHSDNIVLAIEYRHAWADTGKGGVDDAEADNMVGSFRYRF